MMNDQWTERLSEYLDGELAHAETEALEAHLMQCADCGRTLQQLRSVVTRAGQVLDRAPERDLWTGIAARIETERMQPVTAMATSRGKRRISFSVPQLAVASVVLMLMSAGTMYLMVNGDEAAAPVAQVTPAAPQPAATSVRAVTRNYDATVSELEAVLQRNRNQLDTTTVRVLEQNLAIIERAINEARGALGQEPSNPYLGRYLDQAMQRKVQLLRRATSVMRAET
ncbi:MAG TPA: zf-HC2 domain-containing protein [Longimicrobiales bacterium]|nr:zf-HC2 domain-containing protein [Longimicrobiales bacterium]